MSTDDAPRALHRLRARAFGPGGLTVALTAAVGAAGAAAAAHLPTDPLLPVPPLGGWTGLAVLVVALVVTELGQAHVEVRRQAYSFSLGCVPLVLGVLFCSPEVLVVARVATAALVFALQRTRPVKAAYNLAAYLLDASLVLLLVHAVTGTQEGLDVRLALAVYTAVAVSDLLMSCLVLLVIRINTGPVPGGDVADVLVSSSAFVVINVVGGLLAALLASSGTLGLALLAVFVAVTVVVYRLYLVLRRRHASLELVKDFVDLGARTSAAEGDLAAVLLERIRSVLRAEHAQLVVPGGPGGPEWVVAAVAREDDDAAVSGPDAAAVVPAEPGAPGVTGRRSHDAALLEVARGGEGLLVTARSQDGDHRRWLAANGLRDAMLHPLDPGGAEGVVVVSDRLGETASFTTDDLSLLRALTGHLAVALRSARLLDRLRHDATHDGVTGLANLAGLQERGTSLLERCLVDGGGLAVLVIGLERVGEVKAVLGHHVGDELLTVVAHRLQGVLGGSPVARLDGDQFAALVEGSPEQPALDAALLAAARVERLLTTPVQLRDTSVATGATVGVAVAEPGEGLGDVLRRADTARSAASGTAVVYTAAMDVGRAERVELLADLHRALENDELVLHYQPKLDLAFGVVTGVEALVRWQHPRLGLIGPERFVPLAESTGLIEPFTHLLLAQALRQCRTWRDQGVDLSVAVNLSAHNVGNPELPALVAAALASAGVPADRLVLELTESTLMSDPEATAVVLQRLTELGVTVSLDDFGTGYSSLSRLQRLPVGELKVDRSFVRGLEAGATAEDAAVSAALIRSIVDLKSVLGLRIVAEGVEDAEVLEQLRSLGADVVQGYYVDRPRPAERFDTSRCRMTTTDGSLSTW